MPKNIVVDILDDNGKSLEFELLWGTDDDGNDVWWVQQDWRRLVALKPTSNDTHLFLIARGAAALDNLRNG